MTEVILADAIARLIDGDMPLDEDLDNEEDLPSEESWDQVLVNLGALFEIR